MIGTRPNGSMAIDEKFTAGTVQAFVDREIDEGFPILLGCTCVCPEPQITGLVLFNTRYGVSAKPFFCRQESKRFSAVTRRNSNYP